MTATHLVSGQVWSLKDCSYLAGIQIIETRRNQEIVHVSILDTDGKIHVGHMPFARSAFFDSISQPVSLVISKAEFNEGYDYWCAEFDKGGAGIFAISVCEALGL